MCLGAFDFLPGSSHVIAAVSPQMDRTGKMWVFDSFSNGMGLNSVYTADQNVAVTTVLTAKFEPAVQAAFLTNPPGLKLMVDGRNNWPSYTFVWGAGTTHQVSAPATQTDSKGRQWTFQGWAHGGAASQELTVNANSPAVRWTATYSALGQVRVLTNPIGMKVKLDGVECTTPCSLDRAAGTEIGIEAPPSTPINELSRMDFLGWSDGGSPVRTFTFNSDVRTITANYGNSYRMLVAADPEGGVNFRLDPPSPDMFYLADTSVTITAQPARDSGSAAGAETWWGL